MLECNIANSQHNCKKGRTVCKICYNNHVLAYYKIDFCLNSSANTDAITQTDFSNKQASANKHDNSTEKDISNKQSRSESDNVLTKMIIKEILGTKAKTKSQYNTLCTKSDFK